MDVKAPHGGDREEHMPATRKIPRQRLVRYFDGYTKRFLHNRPPRAIDLEVVSMDLGSQLAAHGLRLVGLAYDPHVDSLELALDSGDHRVLKPGEVWVIEEPDGFVSVIAVIGPDGSRQVVSVARVGLLRRE
jgi:hypothetical protein